MTSPSELEKIGFINVNRIQVKNKSIKFPKKELPLTKLYDTEIYLLSRESNEGKIIYKGVEKLSNLEKDFLKWKTVYIIHNSPIFESQTFSILILILEENEIIKKIISNEFSITSEDDPMSGKLTIPPEFKWPEEIIIPGKISGREQVKLLCKDFEEALGSDDPSNSPSSIDQMIERMKGKFEQHEQVRRKLEKLETECDELRKKNEKLEQLRKTDTQLVTDSLELAGTLQEQNKELERTLKKYKKESSKRDKKGKKEKKK